MHGCDEKEDLKEMKERENEKSSGFLSWKAVRIMLTIVLAGGACVLLAFSISKSGGVYLRVDELLENGEKWRGRDVWLGGRLVSEPSVVETGTHGAVQYAFEMEWNGKHITVEYRGKLPARFTLGAKTTARGKLSGSGVFIARKVTTRCPSKYRSRKSSRMED